MTNPGWLASRVEWERANAKKARDMGCEEAALVIERWINLLLSLGETGRGSGPSVEGQTEKR